ncbi:MAG: hypothetical protein HQ568_03425 [Calditrichaeota bacterium]|nr:hypothetical protein [Calditrichota bacterium]
MKTFVISVLSVLIAVFCIFSCGNKAVSTGFLNQPEARDAIPAGLPVTITIIPFEGEARVGRIAEGLIEKRLYLMGYDIVPFEKLKESILPDPSHSCDFTSEDNRAFLSEIHGLEGLITGEYSVVSRVENAAAYLEVSLIDIETGSVLWQGESDDQSWPVTVTGEQEAAGQIVAALMKSLKKDLKKFSKTVSK